MKFSSCLAALFAFLSAILGAPATVAQPVNAVGFFNAVVLPKFNLLSAPLLNNDRPFTIADLARGIQGGAPDGLTVYFLGTNAYRSATYSALLDAFEPSHTAAEEIPPGRGFFLYNPTTNNLPLTFAGTIMQGSLTNPLPAGFSIASSMVPQFGSVELLEFPAEPGDIIFRFDPVLQRFVSSVFDDLDLAWLPVVPRIQVAEAVIVFKVRSALWTRVFFVNP